MSTSDFERIRYFDGRDEKPSTIKKIFKLIFGIVLLLIVIGSIGSCIEGKNAPAVVTPRVNMPFSRISWQWYSGDRNHSIYVINTDAPANAQLMVTYVMGRLENVELIRSSDNQKGDAVRRLVETLYVLEAELRSMGKDN